MSPESPAQPETKTTYNTVRVNHESRLKEHLRGKPLKYQFLWNSVEYFVNGTGRTYLLENRPFTKEEWKKLLIDTHRPIDDPYLN